MAQMDCSATWVRVSIQSWFSPWLSTLSRVSADMCPITRCISSRMNE